MTSELKTRTYTEEGPHGERLVIETVNSKGECVVSVTADMSALGRMIGRANARTTPAPRPVLPGRVDAADEPNEDLVWGRPSL